MKFVFALAMTVSTAAIAKTSAPPIDRSDVAEVTVLSHSFVPLNGQSLVEALYSSSNSTSDFKFSGVLIYNSKTKWSTLGVGYSYGFSDRITAGVKISQSLSYTSSTNYANASTGTDYEVKESGTYDPVLAMNWRMRTQNEAGMDLDLTGTYSPKLMPARSSSTAKDGLVGKGYHSLSLLFTATKHSGPAEYGGAIGKSVQSDSTVDDGTGGEKTGKSDGTLILTGFYLHRIDRFYVGGDVAMAQIGESSSTSGGTKTTSDSLQAKSVSLQGKYLLTENSGLSLTWREMDVDSIIAKGSGVTGKVDGIRSVIYELAYSLTF